jgi:hypothetical protein
MARAHFGQRATLLQRGFGLFYMYDVLHLVTVSARKYYRVGPTTYDPISQFSHQLIQIDS